MIMDTYTIAILFVTISVGFMAGVLLVEMYRDHQKRTAHLDQYAQLRKHWEEKRIKEIEKAQADKVSTQGE